MSEPVALVEIWRADRIESRHLGHAVVVRADGEIVARWGDPEAVIYPRSSSKMIQALPLVETGAADAAGLSTEELALACASHNGAHIHTDRVEAWIARLGLGDDAFRCGAHMPRDAEALEELTCAHQPPRQAHNTCSGKHAGFLTLNAYLHGGPDYVEIDHPVQQLVQEAWEDVTGAPVQGWAVDGCSAPNFATTLAGLARAMAFFATARPDGPKRARAALRLREAMVAHPELVAGEGGACTRLMRAMDGVAVKSGAEGVFVAILPGQGLGVALKVADGATRAAEATMAALLVRLGELDPASEVASSLIDAPLVNWRGITVGYIRPAAGVL